MIDAYAGAIGVLGGFAGEPEKLERQLALIAGTSSCIVAFSKEMKPGFGMWGPYYEAAFPRQLADRGRAIGDRRAARPRGSQP
jgi:ribulose kinase